MSSEKCKYLYKRLTDQEILDLINGAGKEYGYEISLTGLRSIGAGKSSPQLETMFFMMKALDGFSIDYGLTGESPRADLAENVVSQIKGFIDQANMDDPKAQEALKIFRTLSTENKELLLGILKGLGGLLTPK